MKILKSFYLSRVSHEVAIVLFLLKPVNKLRYIFIPDLGQRFVSPSQPNTGYVHAVSWKRKHLLTNNSIIPARKYAMKFEAIFVYKQAEKALTSISYLLFFFFYTKSYINPNPLL